MPKRDSALLIEDMLSAIRKIECYMTGLEREGLFLTRLMEGKPVERVHIAFLYRL